MWALHLALHCRNAWMKMLNNSLLSSAAQSHLLHLTTYITWPYFFVCFVSSWETLLHAFLASLHSCYSTFAYPFVNFVSLWEIKKRPSWRIRTVKFPVKSWENEPSIVINCYCYAVGCCYKDAVAVLPKYYRNVQELLFRTSCTL